MPRLGHSPEQMTIVAGTGLDDEAVDFVRHGFPALNRAEEEQQTNERLGKRKPYQVRRYAERRT
jgi:hypothetical protein